MTQKKMKDKFEDFETAIARLEEITDRLESSDIKLEESLTLYTEGVEIAAFCSQQLTQAEKKMKMIKEQNKELLEVPFDAGEEDD